MSSYGDFEISNGETGGFTMIRFNGRKDNIENNIDINIDEPKDVFINIHNNLIMVLNNR
jgi:hypothetical protein